MLVVSIDVKDVIFEISVFIPKEVEVNGILFVEVTAFKNDIL